MTVHYPGLPAPLERAQPFRRPGNLLLRSLSSEDLAVLWPLLEPVPLQCGIVISAQNEPITFVCFPECGVTSIADVQADGTRVEVALIGREGMTNSQILLGCEEAPHEAHVQIGNGRSLRLSADRLHEFCRQRPDAHALFLRFIHALSIQTVRTLSSNLHDSVERRLSRWLLMCHDRIEGDEIHLLHEAIARMLGVRRATVTDTLHVLEGQHAIKSTRGCVLVRNRGVLTRLAGDSYGFAEAHYRRLIGPFGEPSP